MENKIQTALRFCDLDNFIKFTISPPLVSLSRAEAFQLKNQAYKTAPKNPRLFDRKVVFQDRFLMNDVIKCKTVHEPMMADLIGE